MKHFAYAKQARSTYPVCIVVPMIRSDDILKEYLLPFGIEPDDVIIINLFQEPGKKKTSAKEQKSYIENELAPVLKDLEVQYLVVGDSDYFKTIAKVQKAEINLGYVLDSSFGSFKTIYVPNYRTVFYDPVKIRPKIAQGMNALIAHATSTYVAPGNDIVKFEAYPETDDEIAQWLLKLLEMECPLTVDIEAFSLKHNTAGIGTISFAWSQHDGIAFAVDYVPIEHDGQFYGKQVRNESRRALLRTFFEKLLHNATYHHISYDVSVLIYQLYMEHINDTEGLLHGMDILLRDWDDTKLITYLATNSCAGNKLGLKDQSQEYSGNYAQEEIHDIRKIPLPQLLRYNLIDTLSTWFVKNKWWDKMIEDEQEDIYVSLFKPSILDIIQMQLTGMPINMARVLEVEILLMKDEHAAMNKMVNSKIVQEFTYMLNEAYADKMNAKWVKKRITAAEANEEFNPNSGPQLQRLLFEMLGLPVLELTDSKQPSTDGDTLLALKNHTKDPDVLEFLGALIDYKSVNKILTSFIPAFKNAAQGPDGWHYLFGNFNMGGTLSGRLSSSDPNLQTIPANSKYAKLIKSCFQAPDGWLFCGLDFASLEDRISALTTKDPNKLKVYTDGYDGHSLRAYAYFGDRMPDIQDTVASINSIQDKYKHDRFLSKAPTFALTYQGTYITLIKNCGFTEEVAKDVEKKYHELYKVSDAWVDAKLQQASIDGYVTCAFGLRVRTPLLHQVIRGNSKTPYEAQAEGRTAGNALGQSWCLLNSRASAEFMGKVRTSKHRLNIRPCAHIHDAQYHLIKDDIDAILFTNKHLVKAVQWQEDPLIQHDEVKLGGELSVFWPSWQNEIGIPNDASHETVLACIDAGVEKWNNPPPKK